MINTAERNKIIAVIDNSDLETDKLRDVEPSIFGIKENVLFIIKPSDKRLLKQIRSRSRAD